MCAAMKAPLADPWSGNEDRHSTRLRHHHPMRELGLPVDHFTRTNGANGLDR